MRRSLGLGSVVVGLCVPLVTGCLEGSGTEAPDVEPIGGAGGQGSGGSGSGTGGSGSRGDLGAACAELTPCRAGLACEAGVCVATGNTPVGSSCVTAPECADDGQCVSGVCVPAGEAAEGESCASDADCGPALRCGLVGFGLECVAAGDAGLGDACAAPEACVGGLICADGTCAPAPPGVPTFVTGELEQVDCAERVGEDETVTALFEVPDGPNPLADDFFALPFPSDARLVDGVVDLEGFPTSGPGLIGVDLVKTYVDALDGAATGWGASPSVVFRFTGEIDYGTLVSAEGYVPVHWVDITPGVPEYGLAAGHRWDSWGNRTALVCQDSLVVTRGIGGALLPGHTYALWISADLKALNGTSVVRSPHFDAVMADTEPSDAALAAVWRAYAPLRDYLADEEAPPTSIRPEPDRVLVASVLTIEDVHAPMRQLASAIEAAPPPVVTDWVKCGDGAESPCPQAEGERACGEGTAAYDEYQALVALPIFQQGDAPYELSGGAIADAVVRTEDVCMALAVPKGAPPASGFPLAIYAHGTGGSFRSHLRPEIAGALATAATPGGEVPMAVLGIDQVQHGPRRGGSDADPEELFFNLLNPQAARGNPLQGAADQLSLARLATALEIDASVTGASPITFDPAAVVFYGHSQGAQHGSLAVPFADTVVAAVLSGNGGDIRRSVFDKTEPQSFAAALPFIVGDFTIGADAAPALPGELAHPSLGILSHWIDPADPINFARFATIRAEERETPAHVFQTYGQGDSYSPPSTNRAYALAADMGEVTADESVTEPDELGLDALVEPAAGNFTSLGVEYTSVLRQYAPPEGEDGHFVVFDVQAAIDDVARFLGMAANGEVPQVGD